MTDPNDNHPKQESEQVPPTDSEEQKKATTALANADPNVEEHNEPLSVICDAIESILDVPHQMPILGCARALGLEERDNEVVKQHGCAIIGQTADLAPADKRFYAIRDVTSTVESIPLITASILSKKLAAGLGGLVLDVKCGNGAFMNDLKKAQDLSRSLVEVANHAGLPTTAIITDMNQPLASAAGNAVEIAFRRFATAVRNELAVAMASLSKPEA